MIERSCDGCRNKMAKSQMLRLVQDEEGEWWPDLRQKAPGRGTYLCLRAECQRSLRGRRFSRLFGEVVVQEALYQRISNALAHRRVELLHRLRGRAMIGRDAVMQGLWQAKPLFLLVANDASAGLMDRVAQAVQKRQGDAGATRIVTLAISSQALGELFDRDQVALVAWSQDGLTRLLEQVLQWQVGVEDRGVESRGVVAEFGG
ncbi:MAG: DUF448 domain-containing protein [Mariprofundales bacterium]